MNQVEMEVRRALRELADEGRPVPLGRRALTNIRRRRKRRSAVLAAVTVLVVATVATPGLLRDTDKPARPRPDLSGRNLVAAYVSPAEVRVLDPATGRYRGSDLRVETISPDLRFAAGIWPTGYVQTYPAAKPRLGILDTRTGRLKWIDLPHSVKDATWSPGGEYVVARVADGEHPRAVLVEPAQDRVTVVSLGIPDDQFLVRLCWSDREHLLAVTLPPAGAPGPDTQDLVVLDRDGSRVRTTRIPRSWSVHCAGRAGRVLATRLAESAPGATMVPSEVAIVDANAGRISALVRLPWAGVIKPLSWRTDRSFVASNVRQVFIVDLDNGTVTPVGETPPNELSYPVIVSTEWLDRYPDAVLEAAF